MLASIRTLVVLVGHLVPHLVTCHNVITVFRAAVDDEVE